MILQGVPLCTHECCQSRMLANKHRVTQ